jgi:electron transfer flavoprotein alpha subunit
VRIAVLVKQVPKVESLELQPNLRLNRQGSELEMNAYCRRAVSQGVELARAMGGHCTVYTLGPESAEEVLREAIAWGADAGVLITDAQFAGSDTLATARALAAAVNLDAPWDIVLVGRNSVDADTGQVGPEVAELLGLPFAGGVRQLTVGAEGVLVSCELDDGWRTATVALPAVLSVAERLIAPCKAPAEARRQVSGAAIRRLGPSDLGPGPWGAAGSPTRVGAVRVFEVVRRRRRMSGSVVEQVDEAAALLEEWGATGLNGAAACRDERPADSRSGLVPRSDLASDDEGALSVVVVAEPERSRVTRELLGRAAELASSIGGAVICAGSELEDHSLLDSWGADRLLELSGTAVEEDVANALAEWVAETSPWAVLFPGTLWGREISSRIAARLGLGLTGDAVELDIAEGRLVCWKPAFGGRLLAAITTVSDVQLATVRPGLFAFRDPRRPSTRNVPISTVCGASRNRITIVGEGVDGGMWELLAARSVVSVGQGVLPDEYGLLDPLLKVLGAELAATRRVTDQAWLPRARQVGITGHSVAPGLYVSVGASGTFNHMIGAHGAGTIVAINRDPTAPVFDWADIGIVADWREAVPMLADALTGKSPQPRISSVI